MTITQKGIMTVLCGAAILIAVGAIVRIVILSFDLDFVGRRTYVKQFNPGAENNIVTWVSSLFFLVASALLYFIGRAKSVARERYARHWLLLALIFVLLSIDESASLHEALGKLIRQNFETTGYLYWPWVIPGFVFATFVAIVYTRFLLHLPRVTAGLFLLSGFLFVTGAIGMESIQASRDYRGLGWTETDAAVLFAEEMLEMFGLVLFIFSLLHYVRGQWGTIAVQIGGRKGALPRRSGSP